MRSWLTAMLPRVLLALGCAGASLDHAQAYYLEMSGTVTGQDAGQVMLGKPLLSKPLSVDLIIYTNPTPIVELIVENQAAQSYTFFMDQPASVQLNQDDPKKLSFSIGFGGAGYHTADKYFQGSGSGPVSSGSDMTSIVAGTAQTTNFRRADLVDDMNAKSITVDPFSLAFSVVSSRRKQQSDFFLNVTRLRFADVGLVEPPVVPLPASAPMFATALVAFGLVGRGMARRRTATN